MTVVKDIALSRAYIGVCREDIGGDVPLLYVKFRGFLCDLINQPEHNGSVGAHRNELVKRLRVAGDGVDGVSDGGGEEEGTGRRLPDVNPSVLIIPYAHHKPKTTS